MIQYEVWSLDNCAYILHHIVDSEFEAIALSLQVKSKNVEIYKVVRSKIV